MPETNVDDFIEELGGGVFKEKLAYLLSQAALGTVIHGLGKKKGKVNIEFSLKQIGENNQVVVTHKISHSTPTKRGKRSEEDITETPMFVGKGGVMSINAPKEEINGQMTIVDGEKA